MFASNRAMSNSSVEFSSKKTAISNENGPQQASSVVAIW